MGEINTVKFLLPAMCAFDKYSAERQLPCFFLSFPTINLRQKLTFYCRTNSQFTSNISMQEEKRFRISWLQL